MCLPCSPACFLPAAALLHDCTEVLRPALQPFRPPIPTLDPPHAFSSPLAPPRPHIRVTWKADGTRYMLVLLRWGTYLVDRKFSITRVQMRWPTPLQPGQPAKGPVGPMHHWVSAQAQAQLSPPRPGCSAK